MRGAGRGGPPRQYQVRLEASLLLLLSLALVNSISTESPPPVFSFPFDPSSHHMPCPRPPSLTTSSPRATLPRFVLLNYLTNASLSVPK